MKKHLLSLLLLSVAAGIVAAPLRQPNQIRQYGKEEGMMLDLNKVSLGTLNDVEEKKQYLSTVQLEKQRVQNYMLRQVYENAYTLYRRGDYQRAQEMAQTILSIDPNFTQASTLAKQASHMGAYGTISESEVIEAKFQEANRMYESGRLVEANEKLDEILTIQPYNSKATAWKNRIDKDIAQEYTRRGNVAHEKMDYQTALDNWYNALLIRKDDPTLVNKIAQTENLLRKQQVKEAMEQAMDYYNKGQFLESYAVFERITKIQPGDQRVQKYMSQLKDEIAQGYYTAGNRSYKSQKFDTAISYWNNAKKWGADAAEMDRLIKNARNAKEDALRRKQEAIRRAAEEEQRKAEEAAAKAAEEEAAAAEEEVETVMVEGDGLTPLTPGASGAVLGPDANNTTSGIGGAATRVSAEASEASRQKYIEGLDAFNQDDYERARQAWIVAKQLDPGNTDADLGLRKVEELTGIR
ncbi:MAG: hypothetical protein IJ311_04590 [Elusimicrobiaceae bacterium]|nr:hypothetical protein [Elusimicrobiaceae bacterium]